jgi:hypothetical protein
MVLLGYSVAWGTLIYEKNLKPKISCQTPFKYTVHTFVKKVLEANQNGSRS